MSGYCCRRCVLLTHFRDTEERKCSRFRQWDRDPFLQSFGSLSAIRRHTGLQFNYALRKWSWIVNLLKTISNILVTEILSAVGCANSLLFSTNAFRGAGVLC